MSTDARLLQSTSRPTTISTSAVGMILLGLLNICYPLSLSLSLSLALPVISTFDSTSNPEVGGDFKLSCTATGTPLPEIMWTLDGRVLQDTDMLRIVFTTPEEMQRTSNIEVSSATENFNGEYKCIATNTAGNDSHTFEITLERKPPPCQPFTTTHHSLSVTHTHTHAHTHTRQFMDVSIANSERKFNSYFVCKHYVNVSLSLSSSVPISVPAIIGIAAGGVALILLIALVVLLLVCVYTCALKSSK